MQIYVHRNNQQLGPFSEAELQALINTGAVSLQDPVWWQGQATWVPLSQTPLAAKLTPAPAGVGTPAAFNVGVEKTSNYAIWSLVCGISVFLCGITFIPAIILGHMGLSETSKNPAIKGRGMAIAGLILGYAIGGLWLISVIAISVLIALGNQVKSTFKTIDDQAKAAQIQNAKQDNTDSDSSTNTAPANSSDSTTNTPPAVITP